MLHSLIGRRQRKTTAAKTSLPLRSSRRWHWECQPDAESTFYFSGATYTTIGFCKNRIVDI
jgi:hypothetical protein